MKRVVLAFRAGRLDAVFGHASGGPERTIAAAVASTCLAALAYVGWQTLLLRQDLDAADQTLASQKIAALASRSRTHAGATFAPQQVQTLNRMIGQLNTPWSEVFDAIEEQAQPDVALLSIEPDVNQRSVRIAAEGKSLQDLLAYAERLGRSPQFRHVTLMKHELNDRDPTRPVRLTVDVSLARRANAVPAPTP